MRNLKVWTNAFLAGVGAARVLTWLDAGVAHLLVTRGEWEVAEAVKAAPWVLAALGFGLLLCVDGMLSEGKCCKRSAEKQCSGLIVAQNREENAQRDA